MPDWKARSADALRELRARRPLIHHITNYVVMNLTANVTLALGGSPVMAHETSEVEEMASLAGALVLNIGTLSPRWVEAMHLAGMAAKARGIPVVFDPVGAGATSFRSETSRRILSDLAPDIVRGNRAEILTLAGAASRQSGVDSREEGEEPIETYRSLARSLKAVVCVSGPTDWVTNGPRLLRVDNGHPLLTKATGTGCSATAAIGAFAATGLPTLEATAVAMAIFGACSEMAAEEAGGPGTFIPLLLDALAREDVSAISARVRISEP